MNWLWTTFKIIFFGIVVTLLGQIEIQNTRICDHVGHWLKQTNFENIVNQTKEKFQSGNLKLDFTAESVSAKDKKSLSAILKGGKKGD
jgi:hypothetical protein